MKKRILFGSAMIAAVVVLLWADWRLEKYLVESVAPRLPAGQRAVVGLPSAVLLLVLGALAFLEVARLAAWHKVLPLALTGLVGTNLLATLPFWRQYFSPQTGPDGLALALGVLSAVILAGFLEQMVRYRTVDALPRLACTLLAVLYLGVGGAMILQVRLEFGVPALALLLATVKFTDIGAYFTGTAIGRHKLIPWLSPGKSWEGLAGGLAAAAGAGVLVAWALRIPRLAPWEAAAFGLVVGVAGQFGDLCESLLKRSAGVKDSGALVPGFGGVLDILDSPLLAAPVAYGLLRLLA